MIFMSVNHSSNSGNLSNKLESIIIEIGPILLFADFAFRILFSENRIFLLKEHAH